MTKKAVSEQEKQKLPQTCLIDTNVLISLANPDDINHKNAREYIEALKAYGVKFYISSIVETEFNPGSISNVIQYLGSDNIRLIPYDHTDARRAKILLNRRDKSRGGNKTSHLIDMMIVAQVSQLNIETVITGDKKMISFLREEKLRFLDINVTYADFILAESPLYGSSDLKA